MTSIWLESLRHTNDEQDTYHIESPERIIQCRQLEDVIPALQELDQLVKNGYFAAGFLSYEAGFAFLPKMPQPPPLELPLLWFGLTRNVKKNMDFPRGDNSSEAHVEDLRLNLSLEEYRTFIERIRKYIEEGDTYQVNFTMRYRGRYTGSPLNLYQKLRGKQAVNYAAFIETDDWAVLSLSPELFYRQREGKITTRPMKGTAPRGRTLREDLQNAQTLMTSPKETSENLMIVDLLRNDLGKVCEPGSIQVSLAMNVERYETLLQMTSTVEGSLRSGIQLTDLMRSMFPCGSVTGAPKLRTMQIIHELEKDPRNIYTGSIGFLSDSQSCFNVAIRTAFINKRTGTIEMGVGSGILFEADPDFEYRECELKARFLLETPPAFRLLETMLWQPDGGFAHLELHLDRLCNSAEYFLFAANRAELRNQLELRHSEYVHVHHSPQRVRLLVDRNGTMELEISNLETLDPDRLKVRFSDKQIDSADRFLYHKTTNRTLYDQELAKARAEGYFELLFRNERSEITEGSITNIFIERRGIFYTPPEDCGILPGIFRRFLIESDSYNVQQRVLFEEDIRNADALYVCNAVRGLLRVDLDS